MLLLPPNLEIDGIVYTVEFNAVSAASAVAAHPTVTVGGLKGEHALTGIGASADCCLPGRMPTSAGNLIWKLEPCPDIGGAMVASKDFAVSAPASITALVSASSGCRCHDRVWSRSPPMPLTPAGIAGASSSHSRRRCCAWWPRWG
jgi:hypothetical protein